MDLPERSTLGQLTLEQLKQLPSDQIAEIFARLLSVQITKSFYIIFEGIGYVKIEEDNLPQNLYYYPGKQVVVNLKEMRISKYYINGMLESLIFLANRIGKTTDLNKPGHCMNVHEQYVLCVGYKQGDIQPGISGAIKGRELFTTSAIGEMCEEAGLLCHPNSLENVTCMKRIEGRRNGVFYSVNASACVPTDVIPKRRGLDIKNEKVCVFVHGTIQEIGKIIASAKCLDKNESITHYAVVKLPLLIGITKFIKQRQSDNLGWFKYGLKN